MPRKNPTLLQRVNVPVDGDWNPTGGHVISLEACLDDSGTAAVVDFYGSNGGHGVGVKIASVELNPAKTSDGLTLASQDQGWFFVRAKLVSVTGQLRSATACTQGD